jgi:hypothetical protein
MKRLFFVFCLLTASYSYTYAQDPVVIKEEGATKDLDVEDDFSTLSTKDRTLIGFYMNNLFGISFSPVTAFEGGPVGAYRLTKDLTVGASLGFDYHRDSRVNFNGNAYKEFFLKVSPFVRYQPGFLSSIVNGGFVQFDYETPSVLDSNPALSPSFSYKATSLLGLGYSNQGSGKAQGYFSIHFPLNASDGSSVYYGTPYRAGSSILVRLGWFFL